MLGYASPADVIEKYPDFFWRSVSPHIAPAVQFLEVTVEGRTWLANLYANVFRAERQEGMRGSRGPG
jgi:hypothetical protein